MGNWMALDDKWYDLGTQDYHKGLKKCIVSFLKKGVIIHHINISQAAWFILKNLNQT